MASADGLAFYASVGSELVHFQPDVAACTLLRRASIDLPQDVHYAWPLSQRRLLYVATSEGTPWVQGTYNHLSALRIDSRTGALSVHGAPVSLPARPIHTTLDGAGRYVVTVYNGPFITVHPIAADGTLGEAIAQPPGLDVGFYPHQVRVTPSNGQVIVVSRGHRAKKDKAEEAGALHVFDFQEGMLTGRTVVAPNGGMGFGPRHLDFHPRKPWLYVSIELQNQLQMYTLQDGDLSPQPLYIKDTLAKRTRVTPAQIVGPIRVHPNGRFVYTANRASGMAQFEGKPFWVGGENTIAAFVIDQRTGEPRAIQYIDTRGLHARTFSIDPTGRMLVAAHASEAYVRATSTTSAYIPACLSTFRIGNDGKLTFVAKYDIETKKNGVTHRIYWSGFVPFAA